MNNSKKEGLVVMTREEILTIAKPILFNTEMVRAILDGRKTVTRRTVKQDVWENFVCEEEKVINYYDSKTDILRAPTYKAKYQADDYLYVRETWSTWTDGYVYKAWTSPFPQPGRYNDEFMTWHPSIHMPKEAARIFLRVTDVRVERLQDISGHVVLAEGVDNGKSNPAMGIRWENMQRTAFSELWDSTISKKDLGKYGWNANPWVWVIEFERVEV